jgi:toxin ParE1/3/4
MPEYRLSPAAGRDLADIWRYTKKQWGKEQANRYILALKTMCADLAEAPQQAQLCAYIRPGYRRRSMEHHIIYFKTTRYGIAVVRILHQRMDAMRHL